MKKRILSVILAAVMIAAAAQAAAFADETPQPGSSGAASAEELSSSAAILTSEESVGGALTGAQTDIPADSAISADGSASAGVNGGAEGIAPAAGTMPEGDGSGSAQTMYTLTFVVNGGSDVDPITEASGGIIDLGPYIPEREGFEFAGWCSSEDLTDPVDEVRMTENRSVYARWNEKAAAAFKVPFTDVAESDWSYEDIAFIYEKGLMNGASETAFAPKLTTTRGMMVTILYRLEGEPAFMNDNVFTDVAAGSYYEKAVVWANGKGIVLGCGDDRFAPGDPVTREQMAAILYRYAQYKDYDVRVDENTNFLSFNDFWDVSEYAKPAMMWAIENGLIQGSNLDLLPQGQATREQVAAILHRFCAQYVK